MRPKTLPYSRKPTKKSRRNDIIRKSPFGNNNNDNDTDKIIQPGIYQWMPKLMDKSLRNNMILT